MFTRASRRRPAHFTPIALAPVALALLAGSAVAAPPRVLISSHAASSTSLVPGGLVDERFGTDLGEVFRSPSGNRWIVAFRTTAVPARVGILTGSGTSVEVDFIADGTTVLPWTSEPNLDFYQVAIPGAGGITSLDIDNGTYAINDAGDIAISLREQISQDRVIAKRVGGTWSVAVREGDDVPFDAGTDVWGGVLLPFGLSASGADVFFRGVGTVGALPDAQDDFVVIGPTVIQSGVTPVTGFPTRTYDSLGSGNDLRSGATAGTWIASGDMSGATTDDEVVVRSGSVVAQEGATLGGLVVRGAGRLAAVNISGDGAHYIHRAQQLSGTIDFINRSGSVVAQRLGSILPASTDTWASFTNFSRTFLNADVNNAGQFTIFGGTLSGGANIARIVYNNERVIISDRDPIDLNGNGLTDDNVFVDLNGGSGGELFTQVLGNDGHVYVVARLVDSATPGAGTFLGEAIIRVPIVPGPSACNRADITDIGDTGAGPDGQLTVDDIIAFVNTFGDATGCPGTAPCNRADVTDIGDTGAGADGQLTVDDIIAFVNAFGDGC